MIPAKIKIEIPFPIFLSLISSPSHMRKMVPAVMLTIAKSSVETDTPEKNVPLCESSRISP